MDDGVPLVADDHGTIIGWTAFLWDRNLTREYVDDDEAEIRTLYVHPDRRGEGIGSTLLEVGLDRLPASPTGVVLERFVENEAGRAFYESRGFTDRQEAEFEVAGTSYPTVVYEKVL